MEKGVQVNVNKHTKEMEFYKASLDARHQHWREIHAPLLYDWMLSRKCPWPSACVQFGSASEVRETFADRAIYLSERTGEQPDANTLLVATARVANEHFTKSDEVTRKWSDSVLRDPLPPSDFRIRKKIVHPGEVNRIRELREGIIVTHSDHPNLYVWDVERQPHRKDSTSKDVEPNTADLTLMGHRANAEYAVESADEGTVVASGGNDALVLIWHLNDYQTLLTRKTSSLSNRVELRGHTNTVEGIAFKPGDSRYLCSCGDDRNIFLWDSRASKAVGKILDAHDGDVNCIDWSQGGTHIASGGADNHVRVWDTRNISNQPSSVCYADLDEHTGQVNEVQFQPLAGSTLLGSCAADGQVLIWDVSKTPHDIEEDTGELPSLLIFRHNGHRHAVAEFQWSPYRDDPWSIVSVSEDDAGATLQIWRMLDLVYKPAADAIELFRRDPD
eukprot:Plantae.Rhodophyta-Purpureofilum_apyrenoidigerum.ctg3579.p1 GENE.Plantae.Rhodophyta-Purpureofilum_apyrenoidigerum.ctg3579~~Plantae.Rhodophyta-Purpureofilum_apyrenoidigerum.ctg3579.p1  ORF type:complete len:445 (-),score=40.90 Plantae.Rhodophyta-Purpureofilum_apyrenoidigerum.ctg3579:402-1736(-)